LEPVQILPEDSKLSQMPIEVMSMRCPFERIARVVDSRASRNELVDLTIEPLAFPTESSSFDVFVFHAL